MNVQDDHRGEVQVLSTTAPHCYYLLLLVTNTEEKNTRK